ncbi:MAG TPA: glycosyltransferase family 2 protein [Candidatus Saccharimonadales bacterium]
MFWLAGAAAVVELALVWVRPLWRVRTAGMVLAVALTSFASGLVLAFQPNVFSALLLLASLYRIFNLSRIAEKRMHEVYLRQATRRTSTMLIGVQGVVALIWWAWHQWPPHGPLPWAILAGLQLVVALALLLSTDRTMRHTVWQQGRAHLSDSQLPTITVAIPARNETDDLQACLASIIASDYPKLEVIVLDDCSQTKRTSEIIRGYAHDGVRFIQGEEPKETWLPKNQAYDRLVKEASGQYILFCGVDVRVERESIRQLATLMIAKKKEMVGVLPARVGGSGNAVLQSLRYWWELVPPRRLFRRPPVLSTCWIIGRKVLEDAGGFQAVARSITPEAYFARRAARADAYSFIRASQASGLTSMKSAAEQRDTAVRTRYPQLHRRPENVFVVSLVECVFLVLPFVLAAAGWSFGAGALATALATAASLLLVLTYEILLLTTRTGRWPFGLIGLPASMLLDIGLTHYSMWQYEFSTVDWKGRNICIPAMHVIPHLPEIK